MDKGRYGRDPFPADHAQSRPDGGDALQDGFETLRRAPRTAGGIAPRQGWVKPGRAKEIEDSNRDFRDWMDRNEYD